MAFLLLFLLFHLFSKCQNYDNIKQNEDKGRKKMKLYVIRHGQTGYNIDNKVCGISDVEAAGSIFGNSLRKADESPDGSALRRPLFKKMIPAVDLPFFLSGVIVY